MSVKKSPKIQKLVVSAIRKLQDVQGSTPREISSYISQEYDVPSTKIQRQVRLALARAVSYGILQRSKGGFYACNREFIGCPPQMESAPPADKCGRRRVRRRRAKSCKSARRRKRAAGSCGRRRARKRCGGGRRSRRRSRRGKCGRKSRRRRGRRSACGCGKKSRRRRSRRRRRGGRKCASDGRGADKNDERGFFSSGGKTRRARRSISGMRKENRDRSVTPSVSDEERLDDKHSHELIESPEISRD